MKTVGRLLIVAIYASAMVHGIAVGAEFSRDAMLAMGGAIAAGNVLTAGTFNFWLDTGDGKPLEFLVAKGDTRYEPKGRRLVVGDRVEVVYFEPLSASGSSLRKHARLVTMEGPPPLPDVPQGEWLEGVVSLPGESTNYAVWLPLKRVLIQVEDLWVTRPGYRSDDQRGFSLPEPGSLIRLKLKVVPNAIGSGYTYVATEARMASR